jgi:hypothetical protein
LRALRSNVRLCLAAWREPRSAVRLARALWIAWAVIVWNVVFDHAIVVAGRDYIAAARQAAAAPAGPFANMDDWMRPAVTRGFWLATAAGAAVLVTGVVAVSVAARSAGLREPLDIAATSGDEGLALGGETR